MLAKLRGQLTYANVLSTLCFALVVGGGSAYALTQIDNNSVRSAHIVNGQVRTGDLAPGSVKNSRIAPGAVDETSVDLDALTGADIDESTLEAVPNAEDASTLDGQDSDAFQAAGVIHRSGYKTLPVPATFTSASTQVLRAGPFEFTGICQFAGQESYARMRITPDDQGYYSSDADNGSTLNGPLTLANATIPVGGGTAEEGVTRAFTLLSLTSNDVFQGELFYAVGEEYNQCYFSVSGTLN